MSECQHGGDYPCSKGIHNREFVGLQGTFFREEKEEPKLVDLPPIVAQQADPFDYKYEPMTYPSDDFKALEARLWRLEEEIKILRYAMINPNIDIDTDKHGNTMLRVCRDRPK